MKKLITLLGVTAMVLTCFTGCGNKVRTAEELDDIADSLYKAGNTALTELAKDGIDTSSTFWLDSDKKCFYDDLEFTDDLSDKITDECKDSKNTAWVIFFSGGGRESKTASISEVYVANDFESEPVAYYGDENVDTEGKTLNDIKQEYNIERAANGVYKAANTALVEFDENGIDIGGAFWFDSDKNISDTTKNDITDDFYNSILTYYAKADSCKWLVVCENGMVDYAFAADSFDSDTVFVYPESYAETFKGLTLNEIKEISNEVFDSFN